MELHDCSPACANMRTHTVTVFYNDGTERLEDATIQAEHSLLITVNDRTTRKATCSATQLPELIIGRLLTEGLISSASEIRTLTIDASGERADVVLQTDEVPTQRSLKRLDPIPFKKQWLFELAQRFANDTPSHKKTWGTHSCYLASGSQILYCCEDLGRHNALDKVLGCALRDGIDLSQTILFSSGRAPYDMVEKTIRAGVPIMLTKAVPTEEAIELAREYDLTLICSARPDSMKAFHLPQNNAAAIDGKNENL